MTYREYRNNPERRDELIIPPDGVKRKLDGVVDSVPPNKGCEVLYGELTHEQWGENDNENFADSNDSHILLKWGIIIKCFEG